MKLLTIADGFGDSVAVPDWYPAFFKWPEIIKFMTRDVDLVNLSRYGAGNEYILQCLRHNFKGNDVVLVQWAIPDRFDLVVRSTDDFWNQQISQDPVYNNNTCALGRDRYWLSSASQNSHVQTYHQKYISHRQHQLRSQCYVEHATLLLESKSIQYRFLLTQDSPYLEESVTDTTNWCWHDAFKGMESFRKISAYAALDLGIVQPISLIHFDFIKQFIMPSLDLPWRDATEITAVENMLYRKYKQAVAAKPNDFN